MRPSGGMQDARGGGHEAVPVLPSRAFMPILHPTSDVRFRAVDGLVVLLDLRTASYVVLDRVATAMWQALTCHADEARRLAELAERFDAPAGVLRDDLDAFARDCLERGFLAPEPPAAPSPAGLGRGRAARGALALRAWLSLLATSRSIARRGFSDTYRRYSRLPCPASGGEDVDALASRARQAFSRAENFFVLRGAPRDCLPRSLALFRFLRSVGVPAEHCIGVQRFPFEAHAWVECGGSVVHDSPTFTGCYAEIARLRA